MFNNLFNWRSVLRHTRSDFSVVQHFNSFTCLWFGILMNPPLALFNAHTFLHHHHGLDNCQSSQQNLTLSTATPQLQSSWAKTDFPCQHDVSLFPWLCYALQRWTHSKQSAYNHSFEGRTRVVDASKAYSSADVHCFCISAADISVRLRHFWLSHSIIL